MLIGLTGGMGCGKSTALQAFARIGWQTLDCDRIGATLLAEDQSLQQRIAARFGTEILDEKTGIDKERLAHKVFADQQALAWLEDTLQPHIHQQWKNAVAREPQANWVIEVPLLFEKNLAALFHYTVCVSVSKKTQLARLASRAMDPTQRAVRIAHQWPLRQKAIHADFILFNNGNRSALYAQIEVLVHKLNPTSVS